MRKRTADLLVGPEPFSGLGNVSFKKEIRKKVEAKRSQFWKETEGYGRPRIYWGTKTSEGLFKKNLS